MRPLLACWASIKRLYFAMERFGDPARIFTAPSWTRIILQGLFILLACTGLFFHEEIVTWYELTYYGTKPVFPQPGKYLLFRIVVAVLALIGLSTCIAAGIRYHKQNQRGRSMEKKD